MDDFDRFAKERAAAAHLRDDLSNLIGRLTNVEEVAAIKVVNKLQEALDKHSEARANVTDF